MCPAIYFRHAEAQKVREIAAFRDRQLGREINPTIYTPEELKSKYSHGEHFVRRVMERPKIMLLGTEDDLKTLVSEPMGRPA